MVRKSSHNAGFSLVELILVVGIIGILTAISMPDVSGFLRASQNAGEQNVLNQLAKGFEAYAEDTNQVPAAADVANFLPRYIDMSPAQIDLDTWGNERYFARGVETVPYRDVDLMFSYIIAISSGPDGCIEDPGSNLYCTDADKVNYVNTILAGAGLANTFAQFQPSGDDVISKYSTRNLLRERYELTLERVSRMSRALGELGRIEKYRAMAAAADSGDSTIEEKVPYPPSTDSWVNACCGGLVGELYSASLTEMVSESTFSVTNVGDVEVIYNQLDEAQRIGSMMALTHLLGLPRSYCCTPLRLFESDATSVTAPSETALFYYSNPHLKNATQTLCEADVRGLGAANPSPRITIEPNTCDLCEDPDTCP